MKNYKKLIIFVCLLCMFTLSGCFYSFEESQDGRFSFGVSNSKKDAFCISCNWDGGDKSFSIPDEFMGYKVTTLGGYTGRGYPCPFGVQIDPHEMYPGEGSYGEQQDIIGEDSDDEYDILIFSVHLGINVTNIEYVNGKVYIVRHLENSDGEIKNDILCKICYYFTVDENNPKFYAEKGNLFYRNNKQLITDFFYE